MQFIIVVLVLILLGMGVVVLGYFIDMMFNHLDYTNKAKKLTFDQQFDKIYKRNLKVALDKQVVKNRRKPASHLSVAKTLEKAKPKSQRITAKNSEL
jgi:hypothetical protein